MSGTPQLPDAARRQLARLHETYGDQFLSTLLGISMSSARRYRTGVRSVPDAVAARIEYLFLVTDALAGSYNDAGLRRWWGRPRMPLGGRSPLDALGAGWGPHDAAARAVAMLASELRGPRG